jgi:hypothetical protein
MRRVVLMAAAICSMLGAIALGVSPANAAVASKGTATAVHSVQPASIEGPFLYAIFPTFDQCVADLGGGMPLNWYQKGCFWTATSWGGYWWLGYWTIS